MADKKLYQITFIPSSQDNSDIVSEEISGKVEEYLRGLYGDCKKDGATYKWSAKKSDIEMFSYRSLVMVDAKNTNNELHRYEFTVDIAFVDAFGF